MILLTTATIPRRKPYIAERAHFLHHYRVGYQQNSPERHHGVIRSSWGVGVLWWLARTGGSWQLGVAAVEYIRDGTGYYNKCRFHSCVIIECTLLLTETLVGTNVITVDFILRNARDSHDECKLQWDVWRTTFSSPGRLRAALKSYTRDRTLDHTGGVTHVLVQEEREELLFGGVNLWRSEGVTARHEVMDLCLLLKALEKLCWNKIWCKNVCNKWVTIDVQIITPNNNISSTTGTARGGGGGGGVF